jgi:type IV secretory pathway TrbL component
MDSLFDQAITMCVEKVGTMCEDKDTMDKIYASILTPFTEYLTNRFSWFIRVVQCFMVLLVLQTILIMFLVWHVRSISSVTIR